MFYSMILWSNDLFYSLVLIIILAETYKLNKFSTEGNNQARMTTWLILWLNENPYSNTYLAIYYRCMHILTYEHIILKPQ